MVKGKKSREEIEQEILANSSKKAEPVIEKKVLYLKEDGFLDGKYLKAGSKVFVDVIDGKYNKRLFTE